MYNAANGNYLDEWEVEQCELYHGHNVLAVDKDNNIYLLAEDNHTIYKYNISGTLLVTKTDVDWLYNIAVGPDGFIYTIGFDNAFNKGYIYKRRASDLVDIDWLEIDPTGVKHYDGFAIDVDGNFYVSNRTDNRYEKWTWDGGLVASRDSTSPSGIYGGGLGIAGTTLGTLNETINVWRPITIPLALDEDETDGVLDDIPWPDRIGTVLGYFVYVGYGVRYEVPPGGNIWYRDRYIGKYDSDLTKIWITQIPYSINLGPAGSVCAYPFEAVTYDYPLAPVMFPAKVQRSTLEEKCRNFEESMSDVCLVVNHNTRVTREYLQLTYGGTDFDESSNLRFVLPSQQLVKLLSKNLTTKDYKELINNFITNISSMFTLINDNNTLVKTWLHDYEPTEDEHEFTDVKMKPIVVGKDLSETMDALFEGIIDNVTILNMNLEVLKERF